MRIDEDAWRQLESEHHAAGIVTLRLFPSSPQDIFLAVEQPTGQRMLVIHVPNAAAEAQVRHGALPVTRGLTLRFTPAGPGRRDLQVILTAQDRREVFNPLVTDMAGVAAAAVGPAQALRAAVQRFEHWRHLLQSVADTGLDTPARRGLYGELTILRTHLLPHLPADTAVDAWTGPTGSNQDFQLESAAIEVKTGTAVAPQNIVIANERQLDDTGVDRLLLAHLSIDERRGGSGESLNTVIDTIHTLLTGAAARATFDDLLTRVGYLPSQRHLYDEPRYTVRDTRFWHVADGFPRITATDLPAGVGECRYRLSTVGLDHHRVPAEQVAQAVKGQT
ncbi:PD-(D/E)XK motif protein [Rugosimonospora africana]|uniref:PD-(D/E)XK motif protein n=1 Tax=Rugosimonospora africana TaxID=556532 RepID=A0A8J3R1U4_9ACTN|nr:PD-(D/E)XK motif protein [Rugosimonospora africana]GIH20686.1 hypothetical protein Raf01_88580 [Rugosimonospora africana]